MIELVLWVVILSFVMEFIDSVMGGGFGTVLSPVLILAGFEPLVIAPSILLSEIFTGTSAGYFNNRLKNVDLLNNGQAMTSLKILALTGAIGTLIAVALSISLPSFYVKLYIALLVIVMGLLVLHSRNGASNYSTRKITVLGLLSSFNKGISGGGYGPIIVSGQLLSGLDSKAAVAVTSLAEAITCICGLLGYLVTGNFAVVGLTVSICVGAFAAVPFSALSITKLTTRRLASLIGITTLLIGVYTLLRIVGWV